MKFISSQRWSNHRIAAAFFIAPIIPSAVVTAFWIEAQPVKVIGWVSYDGLLIMGVFLCWVVEGLFAMPVFVTLRRLNRVNLKTSVVTGLLIGTAFGLISNFSIDLYWRDPHRTLHYLVQVMDTAFLGGSIGFFFWLIGVWRNPAFMKQSDIRVEDVFT